jgi:hypothetical protein
MYHSKKQYLSKSTHGKRASKISHLVMYVFAILYTPMFT